MSAADGPACLPAFTVHFGWSKTARPLRDTHQIQVQSNASQEVHRQYAQRNSTSSIGATRLAPILETKFKPLFIFLHNFDFISRVVAFIIS